MGRHRLTNGEAGRPDAEPSASGFFASKDIPVLTAGNADEAIGILETRSDVRAIFTDICMPGSMDGLKLAKAVRNRWPPVNIIITTALQKPAKKDMPSNSRFVSKPYRNADVVNALDSFG